MVDSRHEDSQSGTWFAAARSGPARDAARRRRRRYVLLGLAACFLVTAAAVAIGRAAARRAADEALASSRDAYGRGELLQALRWVNEALEIRPDDRAARALQEQIFASRARIVSEGQRHSQPAPAAIPEEKLVRDLLRAGKAREARDRLATLLARGPNREASWLMSRALLQLDDVTGAIAALKASGASGPEIADPAGPEPAPFVGSNQCVSCHRANAETQRASRHAGTLWTGSAMEGVSFPPGRVPDPGNPRITHLVRRDGQGLHMETAVEGNVLHAAVRYILGSGNRGLTLIGRNDHGQDLLLRMSYYDRGTAADLTPMIPLHLQLAHDHLGVALGPEQLKGCLDCHATNVSLSSGPDAAASAVTVAEPGLGCEKCHGPGGNHLKAIAARFPEPAIGQLRGAPAARVVAVCAQCHRPPEGSVPDESDPTLVRQQALTMPRSRCYTESGGGMSCVTCHNPHRNAETSAAYYERKCLQCHEPGVTRPAVAVATSIATASGPSSPAPPSASSSCPVNPRKDCLGCHMPKVENPAEHAWFTDHHIRIVR